MVEITAVYEGALRCKATHGPSGTTLLTDAPTDNHGKGEAFSPTDLVATALGACMLTIMGIVAERHGWPIEGTTVRVEKHMVSEPKRRIGRLVVAFAFPQPLDAKAQESLKRAAHTCPVHGSLHPDIGIDVSFDFPASA